MTRSDARALSRLPLPNLVSFIALFLAWAGILLLLNGRFYFSFSLILLAFIADFADGYLARRQHLETSLGRHLDSHVDTFVHLIYPALAGYLFVGLRDLLSVGILFVFLACGIYRLARFDAAGYISRPGGAQAYAGLPVVFSHLALLIVVALKALAVPHLAGAANGLILLTAVLMVQSFPFPKPRRILPLVGLLVALSLVMCGLGYHELNRLSP